MTELKIDDRHFEPYRFDEKKLDAWRADMRRTTNTINYGDALPSSQGIRFEA